MEKAISSFKQTPQGRDVDFEVRKRLVICPKANWHAMWAAHNSSRLRYQTDE